MSVYFVVKDSFPSNKQKGEEEEEGKVGFKDIAYTSLIPPKHRVYVLKPKLDYLSFTFKIPDVEEQGQIINILGLLCLDEGTPYEFDEQWAKKDKYKRNVRLKVTGTDETVLIQAGPKSKTSFLRFSMNPALLGRPGIEAFKDHLIDFLGTHYMYSQIAEQCSITRVDVAVDLVNLPIGQTFFSGTSAGKKHAYFSEAGDLETLYLGIKKGSKNADTKVYNKTQEYIDKGKLLPHGPLAQTRVEVTRQSIKKSIVTLPTLKNPLTKEDMLVLGQGGTPELEHHWQLFIDSCWLRGVEGALKSLPEGVRDKYAEAFQERAVSVWRPNELWQYWPRVLSNIGLID
jgi:hypothetical protein